MALNDDLIQKALYRSKPRPKANISSKYNHFKIYESPPTEPKFLESKINQTQTEHKPDTNQAQTGHKPDTSENTNRTQTGHATGHTFGHKPDTNRTQTGHKRKEKISAISFNSYVGLQRKIIIFLCNDCRIRRSKETQEFSLEHMSKTLGIKVGSIKNTIRRLEKKGAIKRIIYKSGRGGWSKYEIQEYIYREIIECDFKQEPDTNRTQTGHKPDTQPDTQPDTNCSSSSSVLNIKETTTVLENEWNFDISCFFKFGFTTSHLKQLINLGTISSSDVEQSLIEFNHDLENKTLPHIKTSKINFLMGLLRNGHMYISESLINEHEATILEMAKKAENKRNKILEAKFIIWESKLNDTERKNIKNKIPMSLRVMFDVHGISNIEVKKWLFNFYLNI